MLFDVKVTFCPERAGSARIAWGLRPPPAPKSGQDLRAWQARSLRSAPVVPADLPRQGSELLQIQARSWVSAPLKLHGRNPAGCSHQIFATHPMKLLCSWLNNHTFPTIFI